MPSATDIEALDNIANEILLLRQLLSTGPTAVSNEVKLLKELTAAGPTAVSNSLIDLRESLKDTSYSVEEILKGIEKSISEIHNDARSLVILKDFWEQMTFYVAEKTTSHISSDTYKNDLLAKGGYYAELVQNKDVSMDRALPLSEISLLLPYSAASTLNIPIYITVSSLLQTISVPTDIQVTITSVSAGPDVTAILDVDNSRVIFKGLSIGPKFFLYTVTSNTGTSITGIANISVIST